MMIAIRRDLAASRACVAELEAQVENQAAIVRNLRVPQVAC